MSSVKGIHHIGIAVRSIDDARAAYERVLGIACGGTEIVHGQKVKVAFFEIGGVRIELLEPTEPDSPVARFLDKRGEGMHHIAYTVSGIDECIRRMADAGMKMIDESPRDGAHGSRVAFLHPASTHGVLTELCEPQ
jgi:methylmalonyl-CoA/ethylmalonyl-CoA epimerase